MGVSLLICSIAWGPAAAAPQDEPAPTARGTIAVQGDLVHTMAGAPIRDGLVLVRDGKIAAVGPRAGITVPRDVRVLHAAVVTPGLIDAHATVGFTGWLNQPQDQDQLDASEPMQPELRAIDAYNARDRLVGWLNEFGVTTVHTGHGPGRLVSGQTLIAKTRSTTVADAVFVDAAMIACSLGEAGTVRGGGDEEGKQAPGTRAKAIAMLRQELVNARHYLDGRANAPADEMPARDLRKEAFGRVLNRELPLLVTADRHQDIAAALRLAEEFDLRIVLDSAAESHAMVDELKQAGVPVIVHPTMARATGERENLAMTTAATLKHAGIPIALQGGFESYVPKVRVVLFEAALAVAYGLRFDEALATVTIDAARLLGIDGRVGSLEPGKDGDLALYDGDPFETTSHCIATVIEGDVTSEGVH